MSYSAFLTDTATIQTRAVARGGYLDTTPTWATVATGIPCRLTPLKDEVLVRQNRDAQLGWYRVYFGAELTVDLTRNHRLTIAGKSLVVESEHDVLRMGRVVQVDCYESKT